VLTAASRNNETESVMKVMDLITKLGKLDQELEVLVVCEEQRLMPRPHDLILFDIHSIDVKSGECKRHDDDYTGMRFADDSKASKYALIEVVSDF
jgi:hypothetical protein